MRGGGGEAGPPCESEKRQRTRGQGVETNVSTYALHLRNGMKFIYKTFGKGLRIGKLATTIFCANFREKNDDNNMGTFCYLLLYKQET